MEGSRRNFPMPNIPTNRTMPNRRTSLPSGDPRARLNAPNSLAQKLKSQTYESSQSSPLEEFPVMPKPGRSIPQFRVTDITSVPSRTKTNFQEMTNNSYDFLPKGPQTREKPKTRQGEINMLAQFDKAVLNPNIRRAQAKSTIMKKQFGKDLETQMKSQSKDFIFKMEMEKAKNQLVGEMISELGFGYQVLKGDQASNQTLNPSDPLGSISTKIEGMMKDWATNSIKVDNKNKGQKSRNATGRFQLSKDLFSEGPLRAEVRQVPSQPFNKKDSKNEKRFSGRESALRSNDKLSEIAQGFRESLQPFATRDPRELIRTPDEDIVSKLTDKHRRAVNDSEDLERQNERSNKPQKIGSDVIEMTKKPKQKTLKGKGTQSLNVSRTGSTNLSGVMDFRSLLEIQSGKVRRKPEIEKSLKNETDKFMLESPGKLSTEKMPEEVALNEGIMSREKVHSKLTDSVNSIDQAAKVAQSLGILMSKVANHNSSNKNSLQNDSAPINKVIAKKSHLQDIRQRADLLRGISEQAQKSIQSHSVSCGASPPVSPHSTRAHKTDSELEIQTQTDHLPIDKGLKDPNDKFEFVGDMSYSDQLILKKLRDLKPMWDNAAEGPDTIPESDEEYFN